MGIEIHQNEKKAYPFLKKAADEYNNYMVEYFLGTMTLPQPAFDEEEQRSRLNDIKKDFQEGMRWLNLAVANGCVDAKIRLGLLYQYGEGNLEKNFHKAVFWYNKVLDKNDYSDYPYETKLHLFKDKNIQVEFNKKLEHFDVVEITRATMVQLPSNMAKVKNWELNLDLYNIHRALFWYILCGVGYPLDVLYCDIYPTGHKSFKRDDAKAKYWLKKSASYENIESMSALQDIIMEERMRAASGRRR